MSEKLVTKGIVLRATATKEADYILNILTDSLGRIAVVARGARRKGSRIAAGSELLAFSELVLYQRGNWYYLDEASTISLFDGIRQDIELLSLASYFAEMTECVTAEDEPVPEILSLLLNSLYALDTLQKPQSIVKAAFELKLLALSGYEPLLSGFASLSHLSHRERQGVQLIPWVLCYFSISRTWAMLSPCSRAMAAMSSYSAFCRWTRARSRRCATCCFPSRSGCCRFPSRARRKSALPRRARCLRRCSLTGDSKRWTSTKA